DARRQRCPEAEDDRRDVLLRERAAGDLVDELVAVARLHRREVDHDMDELAATAGLALEAALDLLGRPRDRLAIGDLRAPDVRVDVELAREAVDADLQ